MFEIIRDAAALNKEITAVVKLGQSYRSRLHVVIVSALWHAAEHGLAPNGPLNRVYDSLVSNDKQALRGSYINRIHAAGGGLDWAKYVEIKDGKVTTLPVPEAILSAATEAGAWLSYSTKKGFFVREKAQEARDSFKEKVLPLILNPVKEQGWMPFYERNNMSEISLFGDKQVLAGLNSIVEKASGNSARAESNVSKKILEHISRTLEEVKTIVEANAGADEVEEVETRSKSQRKRQSEGVALQ